MRTRVLLAAVNAELARTKPSESDCNLPRRVSVAGSTRPLFQHRSLGGSHE